MRKYTATAGKELAAKEEEGGGVSGEISATKGGTTTSSNEPSTGAKSHKFQVPLPLFVLRTVKTTRNIGILLDVICNDQLSLSSLSVVFHDLAENIDRYRSCHLCQ